MPDASFARADGAYPFKQFAEIILAEHGRPLLQPVIVQHETFADVLVEYLGSPLAEFGCPCGIYTITHGDNHVKVVEVDQLFNFPSYPSVYDGCNFCNCRVGAQFSVFVYVCYVAADARFVNPKQLCHRLLGAPNRIVPDDDLYFALFAGHVVEQELDFVCHDACFLMLS